MSILEKLPLINSSNKLTKIVGYVIYGFVFLIVLGIILPTPEMTAEDYYKNGYDLMVDGKYEEALKPLNESIRLDPNNANAWRDMALSLSATERYDKALVYYDEALRLDPTAQTWEDKAQVYFELKKYEDEIKCYEEAIKLNPRSSELWNAKGFVYMELLKEPEKSLECFDAAIENDQENSIAWLNKASALESLGRLDEAKEVEAKGQELWDAGK